MPDTEQMLRTEDEGLEEQERKIAEEGHLAAQASAILQHPLVIECFAAIEQGSFERWKGTNDKDGDLRERLWLQSEAMSQFRKFFEETMTSGQVAKAALPGIIKRRNWVKKQLDHWR